jgi:hypothetical protein
VFSPATFTDPDIARTLPVHDRAAGHPDDLLAEPGLTEKITKLGGQGPHNPLPGPRRPELLAPPVAKPDRRI